MKRVLSWIMVVSLLFVNTSAIYANEDETMSNVERYVSLVQEYQTNPTEELEMELDALEEEMSDEEFEEAMTILENLQTNESDEESDADDSENIEDEDVEEKESYESDEKRQHIEEMEQQRYEKYLSEHSTSLYNAEKDRNVRWVDQGAGNRYLYDANNNIFGNTNSLRVIDVSQWQGTIDWNAVKNSGKIDAVIIRCGYYYDGLDTQFARNVSECNRLGIPYGIYLFSYANDTTEAAKEAQYMVSLVKKYNAKPTLPLYYDLEDWAYTGSNGYEHNPTSVAAYEKIVNSYASKISSLGYSPNIYSYRAMLNSYLKSPNILKYVSWVAAVTPTFGWSNPYYNGLLGWQYSFDERVAGISGDVDMNAFYDPTITASNQDGVVYQTHIQNIGWQSYKANGESSGTTGLSLRLEGIKIQLNNIDGGIEYRTHVQNLGWESAWKSNGDMSGTSGKSLRLEAIQIRLTGAAAEKYDIYYRVHSQQFGWLDWAKNGESAGTAGYSYRLEAIQIQLVEKGGAAPGGTTTSFKQALIGYQTHVQGIGWQSKVFDGSMSGTNGKSLRLEGIKISLSNQEYAGGIEYRTHVQTYGWQSWKSNGQIAGTTGQSKRLEAIQIRLTGEMANQYDVYYRVHVQNIGWMGWTKNGEKAGSEGYSYRLEGIEIRLVKKGESTIGIQTKAFIKK